MPKFLRRPLTRSLIASALVVGMAAGAGTALAQSQASDASLLSALPIASTAVASTTLLAAGASFGVAAVQTSAEGVVWVLERAADSQRMSLRIAQAGEPLSPSTTTRTRSGSPTASRP